LTRRHQTVLQHILNQSNGVSSQIPTCRLQNDSHPDDHYQRLCAGKYWLGHLGITQLYELRFKPVCSNPSGHYGLSHFQFLRVQSHFNDGKG